MNNLIKPKIKEYNLEDKKIIIAVSGGIDSVVLLDLVSRNLKNKNIIVAHVDHGIRKESQKDSLFVASLARKYHLDFFEKKLEMKKRDEATARKLRHEWLRDLLLETSSDYILMAHHLNDQLETALLRLIRGSSSMSLIAMEELSGKIIRPLISVSGEEIRLYAENNNLAYREDESNKDLSYARNRIRHKVVPELLKINPSFLKTFLANQATARELNDFLVLLVGELKKKHYKKGVLSLDGLKEKPAYLVKSLIKEILHDFSKNPKDVYQKNINEIYGIITSRGNKKTSLAGMKLFKDYGELRLFREGEIPKVDPQPSERLLLDREIKFGIFKLMAYIGSGVTAGKKNVLLPASFSDNLSVRVWEKGDKIKTQIGTKKIQDLFTDAKIKPDERAGWPIVLYKNEVIWVPLLAASRYAKKEKNNLIIEVL